MACVYIPVQNSEEEVRVSLDQLPRDATDILDILKAEQAPLDLWLIIAREYFKQGKIEQFQQILEEGSSPEIDEYYGDVRYERIAILNALGSYHSYLGKVETRRREKDEHFIAATQYYNKASRIDPHEPSTWIGKGLLCLVKHDLAQAYGQFKIALDEVPNYVPALLGQACVEFHRKNYSDALKLYKLDPENVDALVALGVTDLQTNHADGIQNGMEKLQRAFEIYPYCVMALNHLANHFFFTGQHFLVEQLTETALAVSNHGLMKSQAYYNLARSYHSKGDFEKAGVYYMASVKEIEKPKDFVLPFYGLGQVQLKLGDFRSSLSNFEKVLEVHPESCETLKLGQTDKALESIRKATRVDPRDAQVLRWMLSKLYELSLPMFPKNNFKTSPMISFVPSMKFKARSLFQKGYEEVPIELLNNIGVLQFERGEFELAEQTFQEALGEGIWLSLMDGKFGHRNVDSSALAGQYRDMTLFHELEEDDAYLRLAALAKDRNNIQLSIDLIKDALKVDDKCPNALSMLGDLELKSDDWGNWNYFAAVRSEKRGPKLEATHLEKAKELYIKVLVEHPGNLYAANGAGVVLAEKGQFDVSKDIFTQVQEAASGNIFVQMPDYQNCLRKFYYNTDTQVLLYLARTHYEAEQWQDCKKTLLRVIHLAPSNYTLRFDVGVAMQKFSASTLQKTKRSADEVRSTVSELRNAVRIFSQLSAATSYHFHGFDEKKIETHVGYCKHLLDAAKVHCEAAEREEQQNRQRLEVARQVTLAEEARRKAEEQRKVQMERRKQEDELKQVMQQEQNFERIKEQWKSTNGGKRKDRSHADDDEGGHSERRRRKGGKRRRKSRKDRYEEEPEYGHEEMDDRDANPVEDRENDGADDAQDILQAAGLEDSDADDDAAGGLSAIDRRRRAWSESDEDETAERPESPMGGEKGNSDENQESGEGREGQSKSNRYIESDEEAD
ncbi:hypothetical protein QJS10_CPB11g01070 [Acorus calamus]|uniref:Uncharacterized protein n=1 Tax=Acorus calamus TaxID=4465 RepID=A0AAV9DTM3_ACOCL|nr:hypothetical protein QJS10_CPB11g01070 [Acorus calamus]